MAGVCLPSLILIIMEVQQMADYSLPASALSGGLNVVGTLLNNAFQKSAADKAYKRNLEMMREQNAFNKNMMLLSQKYNTNERLATQGYNSASAQVSRLRAAGLNPLMGNPDAGSSAPMSSPMAASASGNPAQIPHTDPLNLGQSIPDLLTIAQVKNQMENNNIEADAALVSAHAQDFDAKNGKLRQAGAAEKESEAAMKNALSKQKETDALVNKIYQETEALRIESSWKDKMIANGIDVSSKQAQAALTASAAQMSQANTSAVLAQLKAITTPNEWEERGQRLALDYTKMLVDYHKFVMSLDVDNEYKKNLIAQGLQSVQYETSGLPKWMKDILGGAFQTAVTYGVFKGMGRSPVKVTGFR